MICIKFGGWFQCRLPTGADPADELRGVSGSMKALPGEPDFDRIIRFQESGTVHRSYTPRAGVKVKEYYEGYKLITDHPLIGAQVNLLGNPIFKGENEIVAQGGYEPIVPFIVEITNGSTSITRGCSSAAEFSKFPYSGLQAKAFFYAPGKIGAATGIFDIRKHLDQRVIELKNDLSLCLDETTISNIERRIKFLKSDTATFWFHLVMQYLIPLEGKPQIEINNSSSFHPFDETKKWDVDFWMGAWDPDAACGYVEGFLTIPSKS